jgi:membrane protein DedA with SNARE-associated domain
MIFLLGLLASGTHESIWRWIQHGGPPVLFLLLFSCGLGLPLPEDIPLVVAGAMVAAGKMHIGVAAICAWCGIIGGDCVLYSLGRKFGMEVTRIPFIGRHLQPERIRKVEGMFQRWGIWVVAIGRMFAGIRGAMVVVAGATHFTFWKFLIADGLAAVVSGGLFLYLGYEFGNHISKLNEHVHTAKRYMLAIILGLALILAAFIWWKSRQEHDSDEEESESPSNPPAETPQNVSE